MRRRLLLGFLIGFVTVFGISCKVLPGEKQDIYSDTGIKLNRSSFFPIATDRGKALSSFNMEVVSKYHTRTFDMQDFIAETKAMFSQAWLSEYTPFRLEIALRKYDMEMEFWIKLQRKFEKVLSNYDPSKKLPEWKSIIDIE